MNDNTVQYIIEFQDRASARFEPVLRKVQLLQHKVDGVTGRMTQRFDAAGQAVGRIPGKIEVLRDKLDRLRAKSEQAFDERHIARYNRMIRQTESELTRLNNIGGRTKSGGGGLMSFLGGGAGMLGGLGIAMGAGAAVAGVVGGIKSVAETTSKYEQLSTGFEVLLGSKGKADAMVNDLAAYAAKSPLRNEDIFPATQTLLSFGMTAEKVIPTVKMLGDISMGDGQKFQGLALAFAQVQSTGRLMGQDLLQMINQGFNPLQEISVMTGRSLKDLKADMEKGKISADMVTKAFEHATSQGGKFYGMAEKMSETLGGRFSTLQDNVDQLRRSIGERLYGGFSMALSGASRFIGKIQDWVAIPTEQKVNREVAEIRLLQSKLADANLSENERFRILKELERINPEIVNGINAQSFNYSDLAKNIDKVVTKLKEKIFWDRAEKKYGKELESYQDYQGNVTDAEMKISEVFTKYGFTGSNFTANMRNTMAYLARKKAGGISFQGSRQIDTRNDEAKDYESLLNTVQFYNQNRIKAASQEKTMSRIKAENESLAKSLGYSSQAPTGGNATDGIGGYAPGGSGSPAGSGSGMNFDPESGKDTIARGGATNVTINLQSLIQALTIHVDSMNAGVSKMGDQVKQELLQVLNSANAMATGGR